jgi:hypothetical protein
LGAALGLGYPKYSVPFGVNDLDKIEMRASGVFGLENLHFKWTPAGAA